MFYVNGWVPLREVSLTVSRRRLREHNETLKTSDPSIPQIDTSVVRYADMLAEIWEICDGAKKVGVLLTNGKVVNASKELVRDDFFDGQSTGNKYVDLFDGTVGSGLLLDRDGNPIESGHHDVLRMRYGPFFGLPVLLSKECLEVAKTGGSEAKKVDLDKSPKGISQAIIRLFDAGEKLTRADYKDALAPDISGRQFRLAWDMARAERSELSKPGRRPSEEKET